jgi:threonine aldolase
LDENDEARPGCRKLQHYLHFCGMNPTGTPTNQFQVKRITQGGHLFLAAKAAHQLPLEP